MNEPQRHKEFKGGTRRKTAHFSEFLLCVLCVVVVPPVSAAGPSVTYLFPAGAQRGTTIEVTAGGAFERWPIHVRSSNSGITAKTGKDKGKLIVTVAADVRLGRHWLWLYDQQGASVAQPFLVGTLPEIREQEPNNDAKAPQKIPFAAVTINGRLEKPGDVDCYTVSLQKGQTLIAAFEGWANLRSPMDAVVQVLSADGFVLDQNNDFHGLDPFVAFRVPKDGVYVVRTFAFPAVPDSSIRFAGGESYVYRLTLTTGGYADYPWPLSVCRNRPDPVSLVGWNIPSVARRLSINAPNSTRHMGVACPSVANALNVGIESHPCAVKPDGPEPFRLEPPMTVSSRLARPLAVDEFLFRGKKSQPFIMAPSRRNGTCRCPRSFAWPTPAAGNLQRPSRPGCIATRNWRSRRPRTATTDSPCR